MVSYMVYKNVTYGQIEIMKHAIGFKNEKVRGTKYRRYEPYRNYYDAGGDDVNECEFLVSVGFMEKSREHLYHVTDDGKKFLYYVLGVRILADMD